MTGKPMTPQEAALKALEECGYEFDGEEGRYGERTKEEAVEMILRAFALAGYGWRPIAEARKDGTEYWLSDGSNSSCAEYHTNPDYWIGGNGEELDFTPTHFHELPPPPKND